MGVTAVLGIPKTPLEFSISRDNYPNVIDVVKDGMDVIRVVFKDGFFQHIYHDIVQVPV